MVRRWCVRCLRFAGAALGAIALGLFVLHTAPARRLVLGWMGTALSGAIGLPVRAQTLEYNLLTGWAQLDGLSLGPEGTAALLQAKRLTVRLPVLDLARGEFRRAQITADGLALHLERDAGGRWNLPAPARQRNDTANLNYFHSLRIANLSLVLTDKSTGVSVELPQGNLAAYWQASQYRAAYRTASKGSFQSGAFSTPLDQVSLDANLSAAALAVERLSISAGNSAISVDHARLALDGSDLAANGAAVIDAGQFLQDASGRARAEFSISGTTAAPTAQVRVTSDEVRSGDWPLRALSLAARYQGQHVEITDASAVMLGARAHLRGVLDLSGPQPTARASAAIGGIPLHRVLAELGLQSPHAITGTAQIDATCAGADWRKARLSGVLRIAPDAAVSFQAHMSGQQLALSIDSKGPAGTSATGAAHIGTVDRSLGGTLHGRIASLGEVNRLLGRPDTPVAGALAWRLTLEGSVSRPKVTLAAGEFEPFVPLRESRIPGFARHL
jgi:hypothetical protein